MIPISKQILNRKQKRAAQRVARFLRLWGSWFLCLFYLLFATYLHHVLFGEKKLLKKTLVMLL